MPTYWHLINVPRTSLTPFEADAALTMWLQESAAAGLTTSSASSSSVTTIGGATSAGSGVGGITMSLGAGESSPLGGAGSSAGSPTANGGSSHSNGFVNGMSPIRSDARDDDKTGDYDHREPSEKNSHRKQSMSSSMKKHAGATTKSASVAPPGQQPSTSVGGAPAGATAAAAVLMLRKKVQADRLDACLERVLSYLQIPLCPTSTDVIAEWCAANAKHCVASHASDAVLQDEFLSLMEKLKTLYALWYFAVSTQVRKHREELRSQQRELLRRRHKQEKEAATKRRRKVQEKLSGGVVKQPTTKESQPGTAQQQPLLPTAGGNKKEKKLSRLPSMQQQSVSVTPTSRRRSTSFMDIDSRSSSIDVGAADVVSSSSSSDGEFAPAVTGHSRMHHPNRSGSSTTGAGVVVDEDAVDDEFDKMICGALLTTANDLNGSDSDGNDDDTPYDLRDPQRSMTMTEDSTGGIGDVGVAATLSLLMATTAKIDSHILKSAATLSGIVEHAHGGASGAAIGEVEELLKRRQKELKEAEVEHRLDALAEMFDDDVVDAFFALNKASIAARRDSSAAAGGGGADEDDLTSPLGGGAAKQPQRKNTLTPTNQNRIGAIAAGGSFIAPPIGSSRGNFDFDDEDVDSAYDGNRRSSDIGTSDAVKLGALDAVLKAYNITHVSELARRAQLPVDQTISLQQFVDIIGRNENAPTAAAPAVYTGGTAASTPQHAQLLRDGRRGSVPGAAVLPPRHHQHHQNQPQTQSNPVKAHVASRVSLDLSPLRNHSTSAANTAGGVAISPGGRLSRSSSLLVSYQHSGGSPTDTGSSPPPLLPLSAASTSADLKLLSEIDVPKCPNHLRILGEDESSLAVKARGGNAQSMLERANKSNRLTTFCQSMMLGKSVRRTTATDGEHLERHGTLPPPGAGGSVGAPVGESEPLAASVSMNGGATTMDASLTASNRRRIVADGGASISDKKRTGTTRRSRNQDSPSPHPSSKNGVGKRRKHASDDPEPTTVASHPLLQSEQYLRYRRNFATKTFQYKTSSK